MDVVKIRFPILESVAEIDAEWMWGRPIAGSAFFELANTPFHVYGISEGDIFSVELLDSVLAFKAIEEKRGNRTVRIRFPRGRSHLDFEAVWPPLAALGCTFEGSQLERPLYAVSIPPTVSVAAVIRYLLPLEDAGILEYEEADCGEQA